MRTGFRLVAASLAAFALLLPATHALDTSLASIDPPTKPVEILKNIRKVADAHLLLREDFYDEAVLARVFGARKVTWRDMSPGQGRGAWLTGFGHLEPWANSIDEAMSFSLSRIVTAGKVTGRLNILFKAKEGFTFGQVEDALGRGWTAVPVLRTRELHGHPSGNRAIEYRTGPPGNQGVLTLTFRADGVLEYLSFSEQR